MSDTGVGIPPALGEYIFDAFTQGDSSTTRRHGGTGLGLPISKRLVEAMGGRIWVDSEVGEGSTFYFTASFTAQADEGVTTAAPLPKMSQVKTLIVDDNATNRFLLKEILARWGAPATEVEDGKQALLELTRAKMKDEPYHLVLLDHRMPGMDGFETAERIKKSLGMLSTTIIMLTSENRAGDIETCRQLGISRYLVKPIKQSGLRAAVTAAIGVDVPAANSSSPPAVTSDSPEPSPLRVLLVEDSEDNLRLFQLYLKDPSYDVGVAEDGEVAVGKFMTGQYDLVLMDMQMPVMDGYTATKAIRKWEDENGRKPSVILALTAHALNGHGEKSLAAGCNAHITKPVKKAVLLEALREHTMKVPA